MIKLPSFEWFMGQINFRGQGNMYSGSVGCDPRLGDVDGNIFRYRVWIKKNEENELVLTAGYYFGCKCYDETEKKIITENVFAASADGILEAQQWIEDSYIHSDRGCKDNASSNN